MATKADIKIFLQDFHQKMKVFDIIFRDDRGKNKQTLADLDIRPTERRHAIENLIADDYCEGPLKEQLYHSADMWIFGKQIKNNEVYIKITMGNPNTSVICISFHIADHPLHYPLKGAII